MEQNQKLAEDKVLILYLLNKINTEIKNDNLYKIVSLSKEINYFYYQELITDLNNNNLIVFISQNDCNLLKLSPEGKQAYELTKTLLPGLLKLKADTILKEQIPNIEEESSIISEFIPKDENNYTVKCKVVEKNETIFEVSLYAGSRENAKQIADNWKSNANSIYPKIISLLSTKN